MQLHTLTTVRAALLSMVALAGCDGSTELLVDLRTDYVAGHDFVGVRTEASATPFDEGPSPRTQELVADAARPFLDGVRVAEFSGLGAGPTYLRVSLLGAGGAMVASRAAVVTMDGSAGVTIIVSATCDGVVCPDGSDPSLTACLGGVCVDPRCTPEEPAYCTGATCGTDADCAGAGGCAVARCLESVCSFTPAEGGCDAGRVCTVLAGCVTVGPGSDGGPGDGAVDGDAGPACAASETVCDDGEDEDCDGSVDCADTDCAGTACDDGSACTSDDVCAAGVCAGNAIECSDGNDCTDDTCDPSSGCQSTDNSGPCDDGSWCNGTDRCDGGACTVHESPPCSMFCNESTMVCEQCRGDGDCGVVSRGAWGPCGGFTTTCDETGTQSRAVMTPRCSSSSCIVDTSSESRSCTRDTDATSCGATAYGPWGACGSFSTTCDETGTRSRSVTTYTCVAAACRSAGSTGSQACTRDTDGTSCASTTYGGWGSCGGFSSTCDETGTRSRTVTSYACAAASCASSSSSQSGSCTRNTDGRSCSTYNPCPGSCAGASCQPVCATGCPC